MYPQNHRFLVFHWLWVSSDPRLLQIWYIDMSHLMYLTTPNTTACTHDVCNGVHYGLLLPFSMSPPLAFTRIWLEPKVSCHVPCLVSILCFHLPLILVLVLLLGDEIRIYSFSAKKLYTIKCYAFLGIHLSFIPLDAHSLPHI